MRDLRRNWPQGACFGTSLLACFEIPVSIWRRTFGNQAQQYSNRQAYVLIQVANKTVVITGGGRGIGRAPADSAHAYVGSCFSNPTAPESLHETSTRSLRVAV